MKDFQDWLQSPAYRQALQAAQARSEREQALQEQAPWFGTTGLADEDERELPRYLRREFGEDISEDPHALKAADLRYLGCAHLPDGSQCHWWQVPGHSISYATVHRQPNGDLAYSWGSDAPPPGLQAP